MTLQRRFNLIIAAIIGYGYARMSSWTKPKIANYEAHGYYLKPFVYRALVPWVSQIVHATGIPYTVIIPAVAMISAAAFVFFMALLLEQYSKPYPDIIALASLAVFVVLFADYAHIYDLPTAVLFTACLYYLTIDDKRSYLIAFTLACLNRETAFLLIAVYLVYTWQVKREFKMLAAQTAIFVAVQLGVRYLYRGMAGTNAWSMWQVNAQTYITHSLETLITLAALIILTALVLRNWQSKPRLLRVAFAIMFPALVLLSLFLGGAFEFRTFAEVYPVSGILLVL